MRILSVAVAACLLPLVAACATQPAAPARVTVPDKLAPGPNESPALIVPARGVQIYECRARREPTGGDEWVFVAPEADLLDARGNKIGRHYAGPHWEAAAGPIGPPAFARPRGIARARSCKEEATCRFDSW